MKHFFSILLLLFYYQLKNLQMVPVYSIPLKMLFYPSLPTCSFYSALFQHYFYSYTQCASISSFLILPKIFFLLFYFFCLPLVAGLKNETKSRTFQDSGRNFRRKRAVRPNNEIYKYFICHRSVGPDKSIYRSYKTLFLNRVA